MTIEPASVPARSQAVIPNKPKAFRSTALFILGILWVLAGSVRAATAFTFMAYLFAAAAVLLFSLNVIMIFRRHSMVLILGPFFATAAVFGFVLDSFTRVLLIVFVISVELLMLAVSRTRHS
jgi:hypothetical protein